MRFLKTDFNYKKGPRNFSEPYKFELFKTDLMNFPATASLFYDTSHKKQSFL